MSSEHEQNVRLDEEILKAKGRGRMMVCVYSVVAGEGENRPQLVLFRQTRDFPLADLGPAVRLLEEDIARSEMPAAV